MAFLNKGLNLTLTDERSPAKDGTFKTDTFHSEGGLAEFVNYIDEGRQKLIEDPIYVVGKEDNVEVEVAMQYNTSYQENIYSFVNNINTREGGTHVNGFRRAVNRVFKQYGEDTRKYVAQLMDHIIEDCHGKKRKDLEASCKNLYPQGQIGKQFLTDGNTDEAQSDLVQNLEKNFRVGNCSEVLAAFKEGLFPGVSLLSLLL